jgi:hypothetical protein
MGATGAVKSSDAAAVAAHTPTKNGWGPPTRSTDATTSRNAATIKNRDRP